MNYSWKITSSHGVPAEKEGFVLPTKIYAKAVQLKPSISASFCFIKGLIMHHRKDNDKHRFVSIEHLKMIST